jgi:hypothetical protein
VKLLRDAFWQYADAAKQPWKISIGLNRVASRAGAAPARVIRIDMTEADAGALAAVLAAATEHHRGGGLRTGGRGLIDTGDVAEWLHVRPGTIRGWLSRQTPKDNPFPRPDRRYHGRIYWKKATIEAWLARQRPHRPRH